MLADPLLIALFIIRSLTSQRIYSMNEPKSNYQTFKFCSRLFFVFWTLNFIFHLFVDVIHCENISVLTTKLHSNYLQLSSSCGRLETVFTAFVAKRINNDAKMAKFWSLIFPLKSLSIFGCQYYNILLFWKFSSELIIKCSVGGCKSWQRSK